MRHEILPMRLPRLVTGYVARGREPESVAVHDEIPVPIPHADPEEAPVAFRGPGGVTHHALDGRPYAPLGRGGFSRAWAATFTDLQPYLRAQFGMGGYPGIDPIGSVYDWAVAMPGASRKRGFEPAETLKMREVVDDGRAAQAAAAAFLADRLLMVGDVLHLRVGLPRIRFRVADVEAYVNDHCEWLAHDENPETGETFGVDDFRIDRPGDAEGYARILAEELGFKVKARPSGFEIVDPAALDACYARAAPEEALGPMAAAQGVVDGMAFELAKYPEAEIARYLDLRRLIRAADPAGIATWMEGAEGTRRAAAAVRGWSRDWDHHKAEALRRIDRARFRHRDIELPKANLRAGDEAALLAL